LTADGGRPADRVGARWYGPRRLAAWAPDDAREEIVTLGAGTVALDDADLARAGELLAKVFAVTAQWELARAAYADAAAAWQPLDPGRAIALATLAASLPLPPVASDQDAVAAELDLVRRSIGRDQAPPLARRSLLEVQRALAPRQIVGRIEAAFGLAPEELAILMGAVASILEPDAVPLLPFEGWTTVLADSLLDAQPDVGRLVGSGLVRVTPALVPHPNLISRLLGRATLEPPTGVRFEPLVARGPAPDEISRLSRSLMVNGGVAAIVGPARTGRHTFAAHVAQAAGQRALAVHPVLGGGPEALVDAAFEARLFDALLVIDLDAWRAVGLSSLALPALGPVIAVSRDEPALPRDERVFTVHRWLQGVS
jgi:hypothetical protein